MVGLPHSEGRPPGKAVWSGVVPDEDVSAFPDGPLAHERGILAGRRPVIIVVDMTREFVEAGYPTSCARMGPDAVTHARRLLDAGRAARLPVFFTKSRPDGTPALPESLRHRWRYSAVHAPPTLDSLPPGDELVNELAPRDEDGIIYKYSNPSAFFGTPLASALLQLGADTVVVMGATTSGCVRATVVDAFSHGLQVVLAHDACADRSGISHTVSLFDMHMKYADVTMTDEVVAWLDTLPSRHDPI